MVPKFRAWDKKYKMLMRVNQIDFLKGTAWLEADQGDHETRHTLTRCFDDVILMQSTGLIDRNGVEIFEGDCFIKIFRTIEIPTGKNGIEKSVGIVKFHEGAFQVHIDGWGYELLSEVAQPHIYGANDDYWENVVIGNIYEKPELLEVEG